MTTGVDEQSTGVLMLVSVLEKLRTRAGLTVDRLRADRFGPTAPLLKIAASTLEAGCPESDDAAAAVRLIASCVHQDLTGTQRLIADVILRLELHTPALAAAKVDEDIVVHLYSPALGRRRETLLANWHQLHSALDLTTPAEPSDRALRGSTEPAVLRELAGHLVRRQAPSTESMAAVVSRDALAMPTTGRVIVVGGAAMHATFRVASMPAPDTSAEAYDFSLVPGGKGLTQAVAAARLGLKTSLVAAVSDDAFGEEIMLHLNNHGVDTSLVKRVHGRRTPITGVFERELGDSISVNWRNEREVMLEADDVDSLRDELAACDAVLLTFEVPREVMQETLTLLQRTTSRRARVIVTPGQPYTDEKISRDILGRIDFLVAHPWELGHFAPQGLEPFDPEPVAKGLIAFGLDNVCLLVNGGCTIYSQTFPRALSVPSIPSIYKESSASRDAFCAALAAGLIDNGRRFSGEVALWAAAAMSCAAADFPLANPMPDRGRIEALLADSHFSISTNNR